MCQSVTNRIEQHASNDDWDVVTTVKEVLGEDRVVISALKAAEGFTRNRDEQAQGVDR